VAKSAAPSKKKMAVAKKKISPVKKPASKKPAARKHAPKKAAPGKPAGKKKSVPARTPSKKAPARKVAAALKLAKLPAIRPNAQGKFLKKDLEYFRKALLDLRDRIVDEISFLAGENLGSAQREASGDVSRYGIHMADQGTDSFDREFALSLVSNEQEVLYEIDEALHRIDSGAYGICEMTAKPIEVERLKVLPYARYCREAQEQMERNRRRFRSFAPHAPMPGGGDY
jgi:RNA polymerase-binding transcription factor DksA